MGVDGFTAYTQQHYSSISISLELQPGDRLLIDGSSLLYHLLSRFRSVHTSDEVNFDGLEFANSIVQYLWPFRCRNVRLTVVMDGMLDVAQRLDTRIMRRTAQWHSVRKVMLQGRHSATPGDCMDPSWVKVHLSGTDHRQIVPQRANEIMLIILRLFDNVTLLTAPYEADPYIAHLIKQSFECENINDTFRGVLTNDSDFLVYGCDLDSTQIRKRKYIGYIPHGQLRTNCNDDDEYEIYVSGVTPHALAQVLRLRHVMLLPLLSAVCGNDYIPAGWVVPGNTIANVRTKGKAFYVSAAGKYIGDRYGRAGSPDKFDEHSINKILRSMGVQSNRDVKLKKIMENYEQYLAAPWKSKRRHSDEKGEVPEWNINLDGVIPHEVCPTEDRIELYHLGYIDPVLLTAVKSGVYFAPISMEVDSAMGCSEWHWRHVRHRIFELIIPHSDQPVPIREYIARNDLGDQISISRVGINVSGSDLRRKLESLLCDMDSNRDEILDMYTSFCEIANDQASCDCGCNCGRCSMGCQLRSRIESIVSQEPFFSKLTRGNDEDNAGVLGLMIDTLLNMIVVCRSMLHCFRFSETEVGHLVTACLHCLVRASQMDPSSLSCIAHVLASNMGSSGIFKLLRRIILNNQLQDEKDDATATETPYFGAVVPCHGGTRDNSARFYGKGRTYAISSSFFTGMQLLAALNEILGAPVHRDSFAPLLVLFSVKSLAEFVEGVTEMEHSTLVQQDVIQRIMNLISRPTSCAR